MLNDLRNEAANAFGKLADKSMNITDNQKLYGFVWCVPTYLQKTVAGVLAMP